MKKPSINASEPDERDDALIGAAFRWSALGLVVIALTAAVVVWWLYGNAPLTPTINRTLTLPTKRELPAVKPPQIRFTDITRAAGIDFVHENGANGDKLLPETMGGGCAFLDYDNDGDQDVLLVNSQRWPWDSRATASPATLALYRNDGTGRFQNVTAAVGLEVSVYGMGVATGDYDGDGFVDLFISTLGPNRLFRNRDGTSFEDVTSTAGVAGDDDAWSTSCGWFDYDNDGDLDLFVCNYVDWSKKDDLSQNFQLIGGGRAYGRPQQFGGTFPYLYRNHGDGKFRDVSRQAGIQVTNSDTGVPVAKALGVAFADFDHDGWLDILVANDTVQNFLFHNQRNGTFREIAQLAGVAYDTNGLARGAMGIDIAHFRNDGDVGIAIGNFANEMSALYVSRGDRLKFRDDAVTNGLGPATRLQLTFGVFFFDADLDGRLDYLQANGHLEEDIQKVQETQRYEQAPQLFWNCGLQATEFLPLSQDECGADFVRPLVGRGAAYSDIDGDGDLDVLLTASGSAPRLLRNDQELGNNWLRVKLVGRPPNRDAIGALIEIYHDRLVVQRRVVSPTRSYLSQCELPATFGVGKSTHVRWVRVRWSSGRTTTLTDVPVNRVLVVREREFAEKMDEAEAPEN
ncbi:MAG: CRTAC1 family protein [Pirellulales bacterium]